jgi:magnesium-protoporphyrin O-methyltransferase
VNCCQIQGIEELFSQQYVMRELARYRKKGPDQTTSMLAEAIAHAGAGGLTLLDIGGGVGALQHELLAAGVEQVTGVDASSAYITAARTEAQRRGYGDRVDYLHGNFVDLAEDVPPADIVTLDRVICCYPDMERLVGLSAGRARKFYGLVYPRETWWMKVGMAIGNLYYRLRRSPFRGYIHPAKAVESLVNRSGLKRMFYRQTFIWQVVVYTR